MKVKDKLSLALLFVAYFSSVVVGVINLTANMIAAELPVFIEHRWMPILLSLILPGGSLALEHCSTVIRTERGQQLFEQVLAAVTTVTIFAWLILFSLNFAGLNTSMVIGLGDEGHAGNLYVFVQTAVELMIATMLAHAIRKIFKKYVITSTPENPDWINLYQASKAEERDYKGLSTEWGSLQGRYDALISQREVFIAEKLAEFFAVRSAQ